MKKLILLALTVTASFSATAGVDFLSKSGLGDEAQYAISGHMNKHCPHTRATEVSTKTYVDVIDQGVSDFYHTTVVNALNKIDQGQFDEYQVVFEIIYKSGPNPNSIEFINVRSIPEGFCK